MRRFEKVITSKFRNGVIQLEEINFLSPDDGEARDRRPAVPMEFQKSFEKGIRLLLVEIFIIHDVG